MKHLEVRKKYSTARHIFNSLLGVSSGDETLRVRSWTSDRASPNKALLSIPPPGVEANETYLDVRLATNRPSLFLIRTAILSLAKLISSWSCDVKILPSWSGELVNTHNATKKLTLLRSGIGRSSDDVRPSR